MTVKRPGGFDITDKAIEVAMLKKGDKILDIGCGEGDALKYICDKYDIDGEGIDMNLQSLEIAKKNAPEISFNFGDGEFLDNYSSYTFDGVMMECVLSLINLPDEALHEAYCVLKKGGKLIINDLYYREPDPKKIRAVKIEADRQSKIPRKEGDCEENVERFVDFRLKGAFFEHPLKAQLEEIGYEIIAFEDRTKDLDDFVAQHLMDGGTIEELGCNPSCDKDDKIGYFLLVAKKPE